MESRVESVGLPTGVTLQYVEQCDPTGVPVLLLHGFSDSWHSYKLLFPHLPGDIRAFALTQRGHGDSSRPGTGYRFRAPTLLFWGGQDGMVPRSDQDAQTSAIPDSRLEVYSGAGHGVHWEEPGRFASDLVTFIKTVVK
jgi:pimeloyl-ACP methyl ester carboxylesterase